MSKSSLAVLLILFTQATSWAAPVNREDFDLEVKIENQFNQKIRLAYPNLRFVLQIDLKARKSVPLDLIDGETVVSDVNEPVESVLERVRVLSAETLEANVIANTLDIPAEKVAVQKLMEYRAPDAKPVAEAPAVRPFASLEDTLKSYQPVIQVIGMGLAALLGFLLVFGLGKITAAIVAAATAAKTGFSGADKPVLTPEERAPAPAPAVARGTFSPRQLKAMLAECYWTENDAAAAALIREYPAADAYRELRFGKEYLNYLKSIAPGDLAFTQDPYYLYPQEELFELSVRDTPLHLSAQISQMRFEMIDADASTLIRAQRDRMTQASTDSRASELRYLSMPVKVKFRDVREEEAILQSEEFDLTTKVGLPSLFVLQKLPPQDVQEILGKVSVQEICEAWIGPSVTLGYLEKLIPERKMKVFQEVKGTISASRESRGFRKIVGLGRARYSAILNQSTTETKRTAA